MRKESLTLIAICSLCLTLYACWWSSFANFAAAIEHCPQLFCDFTRHYYPMAQRLYNEPGVAHRFFYSPAVAILLAPLGQIPLQAALYWWGLVQVAGIIFCFLPPYLYIRGYGIHVAVGYAFLFFASYPFIAGLKWGQVSWFVAGGVLWALILRERRKPVLAGVMYALSVGINFYSIIFLAPFLGRRRVQFLTGSIGCGALILGVLPVAMLGIGDTLDFFAAVAAELAEMPTHTGVFVHGQFITDVVQRYVGHDVLLSVYVSMLGAVGFLFIAYRAYQRASSNHQEIVPSGIATLCALPLLLPTAWPHYFIFLPFGQAYFLGFWLNSTGPDEIRGRRYTALALVGLSALLSNAVLFLLLDGPSTYARYGIPLLSSVLLIVVWMISTRGEE